MALSDNKKSKKTKTAEPAPGTEPAVANRAGKTVTMTVEQLDEIRAELRAEATRRLEERLEEQEKIRNERRKKKKAEKLRKRARFAAQAEALAKRSAEMRKLEEEAAAMCDPAAVSDEPSEEVKAIFGEIDATSTRDQKHAAVQKLVACVCREKGIKEIKKRKPEEYRFRGGARP